jgi:RNA polymerase sigma factor (sigma-70 family)
MAGALDETVGRPVRDAVSEAGPDRGVILRGLRRCHHVTATTTEVLDARDDAALIAAVRDGDTDAYGVLFGRHVDAARRLARGLARDGDADDLVADAFAKVLPVLARGEGPDVAFRPYLLTAVRRLDVDRQRALARTRPTDDEAVLDEGEPFTDPAVAGFESTAAARAFASLPERWQVVLWHTEVEGQRPAAIAPLLGLTPNAVAALAHRARGGLRSAFVSMHVQDTSPGRPACQTTRANLGAFIRAGLSNRDANRVSAHLECCRPCTAIYLELIEVDNDLRGLLAPMLLGGAGAAYLAAVSIQGGTATAMSGFLQAVPVKALAASTAAGGVLGGMILGGMAMFGGAANGGPDPEPIAVPPAVTAVTATQTKAARVTAKPAPAKPKPTPTAQPTPTPTSAPSSTQEDPDPTPTQHPSSGDGTGHGDVHQGPPTDPDPHEVEMAVTASRSGVGSASMVTVNVTGLSPRQSGLVIITSDQPAATLDLDPSCDLVSVGRATCRISGEGRLDILAGSLPMTSTTLTITATPGEGLHDDAMADNTARIILDGRV